jgi:hypothetical protein
MDNIFQLSNNNNIRLLGLIIDKISVQSDCDRVTYHFININYIA